jgi:hypothetical protein
VPETLDLAPLQREVLAWRRIWPQDTLRALLSLQAWHTSDHLLRLAKLNQRCLPFLKVASLTKNQRHQRSSASLFLLLRRGYMGRG